MYIANTRVIATTKTIKNAYSNALSSSVAAATGLSDNGFKTALKAIFGWITGGGCGGKEVGVPQKIMSALCAVIQPDHFKFASYGPVK